MDLTLPRLQWGNFGLTQLVPYRGNVVVVIPTRNAPLYIISNGGGVRRLKMRLPADVEQKYAIPAQQDFYIKAYDVDKGTGKATQTGTIYRIDMESREVLQKYYAGEIPISGIVGVESTDFVALHTANDLSTTTLLKSTPK